MAAGWQNKLARLSQMRGDEVRTRVAQEVHKRGDLLRHRLGFGRVELRGRRPRQVGPRVESLGVLLQSQRHKPVVRVRAALRGP